MTAKNIFLIKQLRQYRNTPYAFIILFQNNFTMKILLAFLLVAVLGYFLKVVVDGVR